MTIEQFNPRIITANHQGHCTHDYSKGAFPERVTRWHEIDIVTFGDGRDRISGVNYNVRTGDVFYRVNGLINQHFHPYYCYFFVFDPQYQPEHEAEYMLDPIDAGIGNRLENPWDPIPPFSFSNGPYLGKLIDIEPVYELASKLTSEMEKTSPDQLLVKTLFFQLLYELRQQLTEIPARCERGNRYTQYASQINDLCYYIRNNPDEHFPISRMAEMVGLSPNFFSRVFHETVGKTPLRYVHEVKINRIKTLLLDTEMSVTEIAAHCGFDNAPYMFSMFKCHTGMTPGEYRRATIKNREEWSESG